jgi:uncharacterized membrane protein YfcA
MGSLTEVASAGVASLSLFSYVCMGVMVLLGAAMQGIGGVGYAMFCAPLAAIFFPELVPGPILAVGAPLALLAFLREREAVDSKVAAAALAGRVLGTGLAAMLMTVFSTYFLSIAFVMLIVFAVLLSIAGWRVMPSMANLGVAGVLSGVMGTITAAGGPPFAVAMQQLAPATIRATLGVVFFVGTIVSLAALVYVGKMQGMQWFYSVVLLPWMLVGFAASTRLAGKVSRSSVRCWLLGTALASALVILCQTVLA